MAILDIVLEGAEVLRKKAKPVTKINASIRKLLDDMTETMYEAPGVGLAAPQVGVAKRIIVLDPQDEQTGLIQIINPEIVHHEGWVQGAEGCLSIPGYVGDVYRHEKIKVIGLDRNGHKVYYDAEGWLARIFEHEIDHLEGVLYTDKAANLREVPVGTEEEAELEANLPAGAPAQGEAGPEGEMAPSEAPTAEVGPAPNPEAPLAAAAAAREDAPETKGE